MIGRSGTRIQQLSSRRTHSETAASGEARQQGSTSMRQSAASIFGATAAWRQPRAACRRGRRPWHRGGGTRVSSEAMQPVAQRRRQPIVGGMAVGDECLVKRYDAIAAEPLSACLRPPDGRSSHRRVKVGTVRARDDDPGAARTTPPTAARWPRRRPDSQTPTGRPTEIPGSRQLHTLRRRRSESPRKLYLAALDNPVRLPLKPGLSVGVDCTVPENANS